MKKIPNILLIIGLFCLFEGCLTDSSWNVDQNRLERENLNQRSRYRLRITADNNHKGPSSKHRTSDDSGEIAYSHYNPQIITAPKMQLKNMNEGDGPKLYKPLEDPSVFYKNRVFKNMTDQEKRQRQGMRIIYPNSLDSYQPKVTKNSDGLSIRLNGATVNVRSSNSTMRKNFRRLESPYNVPYSDAAPRAGYFTGTSCVRCPAERTVIAAKGLDKAVLLQPQLQGCGSSPPPITAEFRVLYGPRVGDLLNEGSHISVGSITINNQTQQLCQYRYNVVVRKCPALNLPPGVQVNCRRSNLWGGACYFSCKNREHRLKGRKMIFCKDNMEWSGRTPTCEESKGNWCSIKHISRNGKVTCDILKFDETVPASGVPEGSVCSVSCHGGQRMEAPKIITCQSGKWQGRPVCKKSRRRRHKSSRRQNSHERSQH